MRILNNPFPLNHPWRRCRSSQVKEDNLFRVQIDPVESYYKEKKKGRLSVWVEMVGLVLKEFSRPVDCITAPQ